MRLRELLSLHHAKCSQETRTPPLLLLLRLCSTVAVIDFFPPSRENPISSASCNKTSVWLQPKPHRPSCRSKTATIEYSPLFAPHPLCELSNPFERTACRRRAGARQGGAAASGPYRERGSCAGIELLAHRRLRSGREGRRSGSGEATDKALWAERALFPPMLEGRTELSRNRLPLCWMENGCGKEWDTMTFLGNGARFVCAGDRTA